MAFVTYLCPRLWPLAVAYTMWMWFATMYLTHHYLIDLVGGSIYALSTFFIARRYLPARRADARTRLDYLGIPQPSLSACATSLVRSIEFRRNFRAEKTSMVQNMVHASTLEVDGETQDVYVLMEPEVEEKMSLRLRKFDSEDEEENFGLSSGTSSPAEPVSPTTPRTPLNFSQFPLQTKA